MSCLLDEGEHEVFVLTGGGELTLPCVWDMNCCPPWVFNVDVGMMFFSYFEAKPVSGQKFAPKACPKEIWG